MVALRFDQSLFQRRVGNGVERVRVRRDGFAEQHRDAAGGIGRRRGDHGRPLHADVADVRVLRLFDGDFADRQL